MGLQREKPLPWVSLLPTPPSHWSFPHSHRNSFFLLTKSSKSHVLFYATGHLRVDWAHFQVLRKWHVVAGNQGNWRDSKKTPGLL